MTGSNKNPLLPDSLAADGSQGADAQAASHCEDEDNPSAASWLFLAVMAVEVAKVQLGLYARSTDDPVPGVVEAADLLDAASVALASSSENLPLHEVKPCQGAG